MPRVAYRYDTEHRRAFFGDEGLRGAAYSIDLDDEVNINVDGLILSLQSIGLPTDPLKLSLSVDG